MAASNRGKPSLQASAMGVEQAQRIFKQRGLTRQGLAQTLGIDRSVVGKFLRGDKIWSQKFEEICEFLDIPWQEIAEGVASVSQVSSRRTEVQKARQQLRNYIEQRCGALRILGMDQAQPVESIYTQVRVLQGDSVYSLAGSDAQSITKLAETLSGEEAVAKYPHLHLLGLPGSGKTTFLKYLALQCIQGKLMPDLVPMFVALRDIAQPLKQQDLFTCISEMYRQTCDLDPTLLQQLFDQGSVLLLLDGEDEIPAVQAQTLALTEFDLFYKNRVVITCRTAASRQVYEQFTQATIQQFTDNQIEAFSHHWFQTNPDQASSFIAWLKTNKADFRDTFDLASTPLLLTLLCIAFESAREKPQQRHQIYEMAFEHILGDLNFNHMLPTSAVIPTKTYQEKMALLKAIARAAFNYDEKVFPASRDFLGHAGIDLHEQGGLSPNEFLRELEASYGIITQDSWNHYRFSHLSFHEYFVALALMDEIYADPETAFSILFHESHLFNPAWYEVFWFIAQMLPSLQRETFLQTFKVRLSGYLQDQNPQALEQVAAGGAIAARIIHLFKTHPNSPTSARDRVDTHPMESAITISAFCSDYYYRFDPARRISRVFDGGYQFNHDLVLAHCFKCNLSSAQKQKLKAGKHFDFADALIHVWHQEELHQTNQQLETIDQVRALFFDYVLQQPAPFSAICKQRFKREVSRLAKIAKLSTHQEILEKSKLVAEVSNPDQEKHPFLGSAKYRFPTLAYDDPEAVTVLSNYYYGCTLLCNCLPSEPASSLQQSILQGLFLVSTTNEIVLTSQHKGNHK